MLLLLLLRRRLLLAEVHWLLAWSEPPIRPLRLRLRLQLQHCIMRLPLRLHRLLVSLQRRPASAGETAAPVVQRRR